MTEAATRKSGIVRVLFVLVTVFFVLVAFVLVGLTVEAFVRLPVTRTDVAILLRQLAGLGLTLVVLALLRRFVQPIAHGDDPFTVRSVRRIRQLAWLVLIGFP